MATSSKHVYHKVVAVVASGSKPVVQCDALMHRYVPTVTLLYLHCTMPCQCDCTLTCWTNFGGGQTHGTIIFDFDQVTV